MHVDCWIQQVTTRVGAVTCWIQQSVSPKQVVGFSCLFNSEVDQLINKVIVCILVRSAVSTPAAICLRTTMFQQPFTTIMGVQNKIEDKHDSLSMARLWKVAVGICAVFSGSAINLV